MGLFDWMQRKGSVGSVVRWAYKHYSRIHFEKPELTDKEICEFIFNVRYQMKILASSSTKQRLEKVEVNVDINSIIDLCMVIYQIEMDISPMNFNLYDITERNAQIVLNQLNKKNKTNYY